MQHTVVITHDDSTPGTHIYINVFDKLIRKIYLRKDGFDDPAAPPKRFKLTIEEVVDEVTEIG